MLSRPLRACYKALLRQIWELERTPLAFKLQTPLDKHAWLRQGGGHGWAKVGSEHRAQTARLLLPWLAEVRDAGSDGARGDAGYFVAGNVNSDIMATDSACLQLADKCE